ncbi:MAG: tetratricopeptide repeat protein [Prolixibacteraceae bacterium]|nr:tetratricopeptide repeat protein [Prolixibacteraceae bacterium]
MKKIKKTFLVIFVLLTTCFISIAQNEKIPVTSSSEKAVKLYHQAWSVMENAEIAKAHQLLEDALKEDPEFFMGHFMLAFNNLYFGNLDVFKAHTEKALNSKAALSKGEMLLKTALRRMNENPKADVTDVGENLVEIYPTDEVAYFMLASFQGFAKDLEGTVATYNKLLEITDNPAPVYNMLGYTYLRMNDFEAAEKAFDKYIELVPNHPNPYDSKGDYFMAVKDYTNAYQSFMKAHEMDEVWSYEKAMQAKNEMEKEAIIALIQEETAAYYANDFERWSKLYLNDSNNVNLSVNKNNYECGIGWNAIATEAKNWFTGNQGQNQEVKTPLAVKVYENNAWIVFSNKSPNEEAIVTNMLEKVNGQWKIIYRNTVWTGTFHQPDIFVISGINHAKSMGKTVEEFAAFTGDQFKTSWPSEINLAVFVNGVRNNWGTIVKTENNKILEQDEQHAVLQFSNLLPDLKNNPVFNVSYDDYLTFMKIVFEKISDHVGYEYTQETIPNGVQVTIAKK